MKFGSKGHLGAVMLARASIVRSICARKLASGSWLDRETRSKGSVGRALHELATHGFSINFRFLVLFLPRCTVQLVLYRHQTACDVIVSMMMKCSCAIKLHVMRLVTVSRSWGKVR